MLAYVTLFAAVICGVMQASLERAGVGRVESMRNSPAAFFLMVTAIPLTFLANMGLIAIVIWSVFALSWMPTLAVVFAGVVLFGLVWGTCLAHLKRSSRWEAVLRSGIPLVYILKLITAGAILLLLSNFIGWIRL